MMNIATRGHRLARHPLASYFGLAFALSWLIEVPLALQAHGLLGIELPFALHYLAGFGPLLAAVLVSLSCGGTRSLADLLGQLGRWRVGPSWWLVAVSPLVALVLVSAVVSTADGDVLGITALGEVDFLPSLGFAAPLFWFATFGVGEETGWRGFALPRLQRAHSSLAATLFLWALWALWHAPLFFYLYPPSVLPGLVSGLLAGAIVFTWIFNSTGGSVLIVAIWHGLFDSTTACTACKASPTAAVISTLVMVWAVAVIVIFGPARLSRRAKVTAEDPGRSRSQLDGALVASLGGR